MVQNIPDTLSGVIKSARQRSGLTVEALAERTGISERYIYRIENEDKKPKFDVLLLLIRALGISADSIFYPEKPVKDSQIEDLVRMLYNCDERSMEIIKATLKAAVESQSKE